MEISSETVIKQQRKSEDIIKMYLRDTVSIGDLGTASKLCPNVADCHIEGREVTQKDGMCHAHLILDERQGHLNSEPLPTLLLT
jgi:hypothetical protein